MGTGGKDAGQIEGRRWPTQGAALANSGGGAGTIFFEKLLSSPAKSKNASALFVPASRSSHTFGHKKRSIFRFLSRTANVFLQKMDAPLPPGNCRSLLISGLDNRRRLAAACTHTPAAAFPSCCCRSSLPLHGRKYFVCDFNSRSRELARDSGQRKLTSSKPNPCASSRSVYLLPAACRSGGLPH